MADHLFPELHRPGGDGANLPQGSRFEIAIGALVRVAFKHALAGCCDHRWIQSWVMGFVLAEAQAVLHCTNGWAIEAQLQVQAIQQRAREPLPVAPPLTGVAMADVLRIPKPAAGTGIGGSDQGDCAGIVVADAAVPQPNDPVLQGLPQ